MNRHLALSPGTSYLMECEYALGLVPRDEFSDCHVLNPDKWNHRLVSIVRLISLARAPLFKGNGECGETAERYMWTRTGVQYSAVQYSYIQRITEPFMEHSRGNSL
jgi:hypothetical protein